jgi:hypothetical protein
VKRGIRKWVVVKALRHGGSAFARIAGYLNRDARIYLDQHSKLIANTIDRISGGFYGAIYQALLRVGVPGNIARTIAWAVEKVLL